MKKFIAGFFTIWLMLAGSVFASNSKAMIIFDASGSMWGQIDGINKIVIARDALKDVVAKWNPDIDLGLTVYGHRVKGDCNDIETVMPIGPVNKRQMIDTVMAINPKGMTPIAKSLRMVANQLRKNEGRSTIILISDGKESCDADPCGTAKQLKAEGIDFVAHVVGFNVDTRTGQQLSCIAQATGGEYFSAQNASALNDAMKVIVEKVEKPKPEPMQRLEVTASETEGGKQADTSYDIYRDTNGTVLRIGGCRSTTGKPCSVSLKAGKYLVKASYHQIEKKVAVELKDKPVTKVHIILQETGKVEISGSETEGGKPISLYGYIYPADEQGKRNGSNVGQVNNKDSELCVHQLPVGKYMMEVKYNKFKKKAVLEVKAGETTKVHVVMGQTGEVSITGSETEGGKPIKLYGYIYPADENGKKSGGNVGQVNNRNAEPSIHRLPVGKYLAKVKADKNKKEVQFQVTAGEMNSLHIVMD